MDTNALLDRAGAGDTQARDQLLAQHRERLKQMIRFRLDPRLAARIDSSDVVQETLASASQRLKQYLQSRPLPFYPWLRQIAWDKLVELHRFHFRQKRSIAREQPIEIRLSDQSVSELANRLIAIQSTPSAQLARAESAERLRRALARLPDADREILTLRHLEQLDTAETAAVLGISQPASKSRHFRAMQRLLDYLDEDEEGDLP
jgi:RNA polymerase sigma-70 factor (ECF subfamily)